MKILRLISSANPSGGGPIEGARQIDAALKLLGHNVTMVTLDTADSQSFTSTPDVLGLGPAIGTYGYSRLLLPWLRKNAKNYDAIIVNGIWQYHSLAACLALIGTEIPYFVFTHGMLDPWFKQQYPLKHFKKSLYWWAAEYHVLHNAAAVLFTSDLERKVSRESFWPYRITECVVNYGTSIPADAVPSSTELFLNTFPELRGKRIVLFLGRIHEKKGCDLLLKAFASIAQIDSDLRLVMAGPDQTGWKSKLEELVEQAGIKNQVVWPGMLKGPIKWGAMMAAEVFSLPSHQENFGIAVAEALAVGTPVLISNKVNIWKEIESDGAGFIGNDDLAGTISVLQRWLATSSAEKEKMRINAQQCFLNRFEISAVASNLVELISSELESRSNPPGSGRLAS